MLYGGEICREEQGEWKKIFEWGAYEDLICRSFMNWENLEKGNSEALNMLNHWQKLSKFRSKHIAVGAGKHIDISDDDAGYTFGRTYDKDGIVDKVVCVIGALEGASTRVKVAGIFENGTEVIDVYSGENATVGNGEVILRDKRYSIKLIEAIEKN